jgi:hypothetical protein
MSDPAIRAALDAATKAANVEWDDAFITPEHTASIVAAFLRALPHGPFIALSPDHIAGISKMVTETLAAAVERAAREGEGDA